jgi:hypothetical protein
MASWRQVMDQQALDIMLKPYALESLRKFIAKAICNGHASDTFSSQMTPVLAS